MANSADAVEMPHTHGAYILKTPNTDKLANNAEPERGISSVSSLFAKIKSLRSEINLNSETLFVCLVLNDASTLVGH